MSNFVKERRKTLIMEAGEKVPSFLPTRKMIYRLLLIMIFSRVFHLILQTVCLIVFSSTVNPIAILVIFIQLLAALLYAWLIYYVGVKQFAYIALFGGVSSLLSAFINNAFSNFGKGDVLSDFTNIVFIAVILIQIAVMGFISFNKKCAYYYKVILNIQKDLGLYINDMKNNKG